MKGGEDFFVATKKIHNALHGEETSDGTAYQIRYLFTHPDAAKKLDEYGHEYVKEEFLITRKIRRYLLLFHALSHPGERVIHL